MTFLLPGLRGFLGLTPLSLLDGLIVGGSAVAPFLVNEAVKKLGAPRPEEQSEDPYAETHEDVQPQGRVIETAVHPQPVRH